MTERVPTENIERIVGCERHATRHYARSMRFCECMDDPFAPAGRKCQTCGCGTDGDAECPCGCIDSEEVGTGAGEGAPRQDTGSAWVTRSTDCPKAPAQAHLLGPDRLAAIQARRAEGILLGEDYDWLLAAAGRVRGLLAAYGEAEGTPVDYEFLVHHLCEAIK